MPVDVAFWDSSAIIPICCQQEFSNAARRLRREFSVPTIWWGTPVEVHSGIARLIREGLLDDVEARRSLATWRRFFRASSSISPTDDLRAVALGLPATYELRSQDAFQLAAALIWCDERPRNRPFICADKRLGDAAGQAGFDVVLLA